MAISGDLRHKIILKAPVTSKNDEGGIEVTYPFPNIETFAQVKSAAQARVSEAATTAVNNTKHFFIRWNIGREQNINKDWLLIYNGSNYIIQGKVRVDESEGVNEKGNWIKITAEAKNNG